MRRAPELEREVGKPPEQPLWHCGACAHVQVHPIPSAEQIASYYRPRGTATDLTTYAEQRLFAPLGIEDFEWVKGYYGEPVAASGLRLRPRDLAKIGQLVLTGGLWDGAQIIPADWLAESHQPRAEVPAYETKYGYLWWLDELDGGRKVIEGAGNGGQELLIVPDLDLVLVVTAGNYNNSDAWKPAWALLTDTVIPAVRSP